VSAARRVKLQALAKLNLSLRILNKRPDGYHEIRSVFQTISLSDTLRIEFEPARRTRIELQSNVEIAENLVSRAATLVLDFLNVTATVRFRLDKSIPMGAG
jgi:4-diphosphocytidyl-2-C-methyl-D-erythritol kinase